MSGPATRATTSPEAAVSDARLPRRIVLGVPDDWNREPADSGVTAWVAQQAKTWRCPVTIVHAWMATGLAAGTWFDPMIWESAASRPGAGAADVLRGLGLDVTVQSRRDSASDALLTVLRPDDLVAVGAVASSPLRHGFGANVVHQLLMHSPCPVAVIPRSWQPPPGVPRIMVAYDDTASAGVALAWALAHCEAARGELILVWASAPRKADADESRRAEGVTRVRALAARHGIASVSVIDVPRAGLGNPLDVAAARLDLLVLGNHETSWVSQFSRTSITDTMTPSPNSPVVVLARGGDSVAAKAASSEPQPDVPQQR